MKLSILKIKLMNALSDFSDNELVIDVYLKKIKIIQHQYRKYKLTSILLMLSKYSMILFLSIISICFKYLNNVDPFVTIISFIPVIISAIMVGFKSMTRFFKIVEYKNAYNQLLSNIQIEFFRFINYRSEYIGCHNYNDAYKIYKTSVSKILKFSTINNIGRIIDISNFDDIRRLKHRKLMIWKDNNNINLEI